MGQNRTLIGTADDDPVLYARDGQLRFKLVTPSSQLVRERKSDVPWIFGDHLIGIEEFGFFAFIPWAGAAIGLGDKIAMRSDMTADHGTIHDYCRRHGLREEFFLARASWVRVEVWSPETDQTAKRNAFRCFLRPILFLADVGTTLCGPGPVGPSAGIVTCG
eukprot:gene13326-biopygen3610